MYAYNLAEGVAELPNILIASQTSRRDVPTPSGFATVSTSFLNSTIMKISIITACFNSGGTLRDTMRSVLSQSFADWEHIIVDGNSKDDTVDIIRELEPEYENRLKWVSEPDRGIYDAMNKGLDMATGDVIGILNSDDFFSGPEVLERINAELESRRIDAVYGDIHFVESARLNDCARYYSSRFFHPWMMIFGYQPAHPSFYCRRKCYRKFGGFDISFRVAADFENMLRLIYINRIKIRYIPLDFVTMRTGGASTKGLASHVQILMDHYRAYKKNGVTKGYCFDLMRYPLKLGELMLSRTMPRLYGGKAIKGHESVPNA